MSDEKKKGEEIAPEGADAPELRTRREFLRSLGRWSSIIIGGVALGGLIAPPEAGAWVNGGGGAWVNGRGGYGGGSWVNRSGGGAGWVNRAGGGGAWVNNRGGGGAWVNRH
jgi:hypothetical protein